MDKVLDWLMFILGGTLVVLCILGVIALMGWVVEYIATHFNIIGIVAGCLVMVYAMICKELD